MNTSSGEFSVTVTNQRSDVGVAFENNLLINHVGQCVHKANRILNVIKHSFCNLHPHIFLIILYISLVRSYASPVWNPYLLKDVRALESVQQRTTRLVLMLKDKYYYDCLVSLNLPSLQYHHKHMDMIMTYKMIHGLVAICMFFRFVFI